LNDFLRHPMPETIHDFVRDRLPRPFGAANWVTGARALAAIVLLALWAGWACGVLTLGVPQRWVIVALAVAAFISDGIDGFLARRGGLASAFGARFDMETDALLVLALALLVFSTGQAGAWVLASGALRYLFVAAGGFIPALSAPLPPSWRRKAICAAQTALLIAALAPPVPQGAGRGLAALGLVLLIYSFGVDCAGRLSVARA
jgi:phosphatidylglycerophosphate synthase